MLFVICKRIIIVKTNKKGSNISQPTWSLNDRESSPIYPENNKIDVLGQIEILQK